MKLLIRFILLPREHKQSKSMFYQSGRNTKSATDVFISSSIKSKKVSSKFYSFAEYIGNFRLAINTFVHDFKSVDSDEGACIEKVFFKAVQLLFIAIRIFSYDYVFTS